MTDKILAAAREAGFSLDASFADTYVTGYEDQLSRFYTLAYRQGVEDAAKAATGYTLSDTVINDLRAQGLDCVSGGPDDVSRKIRNAILRAQGVSE